MSTTLEQLEYGFDRDSRRTWQRRALSTAQDQHYRYDALSQVSGAERWSLNLNLTAISGIPAEQESWDYDPTGNWRGYHQMADGASTLDQGRVHDRGNRLTQIEDNPNNMLLDRVGRMRQMAPDAGGNWDGKLEITWDAWSRITSVKNNGAVVGEYAYDGTHRRITREVGGETLHSYYNAAWRPVEERKDSETTAAMSYLWGSRHRDDLVRRDRATSGTTLNETRYILMDYFNPAAVTDASGVVKERYAFSAFGVRTILNPDYTGRSSSECEMEFAFQGQFLDTESGLMNYGYRYYSPRLGRWTCKDPIMERGGLNLMAFCSNTPVNGIDHLGLAKIAATTECPDPLTVPVEKSYSGVSGTEYPEKTVTCECQEGPDEGVGAKKGDTCWSVVKCTIKFTARIKISFAEAREEGQAHWKIFGHEQRHIQSRCERVKTTVEGHIKMQDGGRQGSQDACETYKASIEETAKAKLDKELNHNLSPDHTGDPGASRFSPGERQGYDPLRGTQGDYSRYAP